MKSGKKKFFVIIFILMAAAGAYFGFSFFAPKKPQVSVKEVRPIVSSIRLTVSTTGTVLPRNRLELKPSVAGRIEKIMVHEGDKVRSGQILALMSSTERAALIDAAKLQGKDSLKYWESAYKPIPIVAPISGTVIVRSVEPGQRVTTTDDILVISDRLIVKAQVDETDIGKVKNGQIAYITLDSHQDIIVPGRVTHIYYESTTVSNVTVYYVVITPDSVPAEFRSGMSATVEIVEKEEKGVLLVPSEAIVYEGGKKIVLLSKGRGNPPERREIKTGAENNGKVQVISGITSGDVLIIMTKNGVESKSGGSKNPFMPERPKRKGGAGGPPN